MRSFIAILTLSVVTFTALAQVIPSWWHTRSVFEPNSTPDDYVAVNQGQLKNFAKAAVAEFNARLPGGAGDELDTLIGSWFPPSAEADDYQVGTVGQLKALGDVFYRRLEQVRLIKVPDWSPIVAPWSGQGVTSPGNADVVNIGQVKELFSSLEGNRRDYLSGAWDSLSDTGRFGLSWWVDTDDDGFSDIEEILHGSDPTDAATQPTVRLEVVSGNGQWIGVGETLAAPVVLAVRRGYANLPAMQVSVSLPTGTGVGTLANAATGPWHSSLTLTTNTTGQVQLWWKAPSPVNSGPYPFFASLSPENGGDQVSLFANVRPSDPTAPLVIAREGSDVLSKPMGSLTTQPVTVALTRSGVLQAGIVTRLAVHGVGGRIALSPQGPWRQQIDVPTGADGRIAFHWRSSRTQPGSGSVRVTVPGQTTQPTTLIISTTSQLPYVLTVISGPALLRGAGSANALPLVARVTQGGNPVSGAEVHLSASMMGGQLSSTAAGPWVKAVTLTTNAQGQADAWWLGESEVAGGEITLNLPDQPAVAPVTVPTITTPPDTNDDPNTDGLNPTQRLLGRLPYEITVRRQVVKVIDGAAHDLNGNAVDWWPTDEPPIRTTKLKYGPENFPAITTSPDEDLDTTFSEEEKLSYWVKPDSLVRQLSGNKNYTTIDDEEKEIYGWHKNWQGVTFEFRIKPKAQVESGTKLVLPYLIETLDPEVADYLPQVVQSSEFGVVELVVGSTEAGQEQKRSVTCVVPYEGDSNDNKKMRVRLLPIEVKVVNRDDPTKTWTTGPVTSGPLAYTSPTISEVPDVKNGDLISWSVPGLTGGSFQWWATGPSGSRKDAPSSVTSNEWKLEDPLDWLPGKWRIHCRYTPSGGAATEFDFKQNLGYRSPDITVIGWIDGAQIILPAGTDIPHQNWWGVTPVPLANVSTLMGNLSHRLIFFGGLSTGIDYPSPLLPDGARKYVNAWLIKDTPNDAPPASFLEGWNGYPGRFMVDEDGLTDFRNDSAKFRSFHRFQARFELDDSGKIKGTPVYLIPPGETTKVGVTPTDWLGWFPPDPGGETGPHDREINTTGAAIQFNPKNGKTHKAKLGDDFEQYTQGRIAWEGAFLSKRLNNLNVPWIWSIIEFGAAHAKAGTTAVPEHEIFPVYHIYFNGKRLDTLTNSINEAKIEEFIQRGEPIAP